MTEQGPMTEEDVDNRKRTPHLDGMASDRVRNALDAAAELSSEERKQLIAELVLRLDRDRDPDAEYGEAWSAEIRKRIDAVISGTSQGQSWSQVRQEIAAELAERRRSA
jgi:hypothetical protein